MQRPDHFKPVRNAAEALRHGAAGIVRDDAVGKTPPYSFQRYVNPGIECSLMSLVSLPRCETGK